MLVFLAADQRRVDDLEQAVAEFLAWCEIVDEAGPLNLDEHQKAQARTRLDDADRTVELRLADAYQCLLVPRQPTPTGPIEWEAIKVDGEGGLAERAVRKLAHGGGLYLNYPPVLLRLQLDGPLAPLWETGHTTVNEVWDAYARYLYLHRLRDIDTLCRAVGEAPASTNWKPRGSPSRSRTTRVAIPTRASPVAAIRDRCAATRCSCSPRSLPHSSRSRRRSPRATTRKAA